MKFSELTPGERKIIMITGITAGVFTYFGIRSAIKKDKKRKLREAREQVFEATAYMDIDYSTKASVIYDSFYNYYGGAFEDEERAMNELSGLTPAQIQKLSATYKVLYGKILKEDFIKYLSPDDWDKVKVYFS